VPLVGNTYCRKNPSSKDTNIKLVFDRNNKFDKNAIKVLSIRDDIELEIGYIIKQKTIFLKKIIDEIRFKVIIKKTKCSKIYYYLIFEYL
jgi:hypothetical protein